MVKPYQRIVSLVCIACETCECERCNVEDLAKRIIDDVRADAIDECIEVFRNIPRHYYLDEFLNELEQLKEEDK